MKLKFKSFTIGEEELLLFCAASLFLPFYLCSAVLLITFVLALLKNKDIIKILTPKHSRWFYAFSALAIAVGAVNANWYGVVVFELFALIALFGFYESAAMTDKLRNRIINIAAAGIIVALAAALVQKIPNGNYRSVSFFANANFYGYICEMLIVVFFYALLHYGPKIQYFLGLAACLGGIVASGCRSAWLAFFLGAVVVLICLKKYRILIVTGIFSLAAGLSVTVLPSLLFPRYSAFTSDKNLRFLIWKTAIGIIKTHPLFGQGMMSYVALSTGRAHDFHAHDILLDLLVNFGIIGTVIFAVSFFFLAKRLISGLRENSACAAALGVMAATLVHGVTDVPFLSLQSCAMLVTIIALSGINKKPEDINVQK